MPQITIQKGQTLSGLAQQYGTTIQNLMAINPQIKDPNLIYTGASLAIPEITPTVPPVVTEPVAKATEVASQLGVGVGTTTPPDTTPSQDYSAMLEAEYTKSGIGTVKGNVSAKDTEITGRKALRDQMLLDEMGKPIPQWMITGRKKLEIDAATGDLNRMIDERNALANQYNTGLAETERKVNYAINYQKEMTRQLETKTKQEQWEKEYALALEKAKMPKEPIKPPVSYQEWQLAGSPGTFEEWLIRKEKPKETVKEAEEEEDNLWRKKVEEEPDKYYIKKNKVYEKKKGWWGWNDELRHILSY